MQFHLNGFRTGDPSTFGAAERQPFDAETGDLPADVDVLIVGCGPAGLTLAAQLASFGDIRTCIVDQKLGPLQLGQADGIACRTMEMLNAFGFADRILREAYWVNETSFWRPGDDPAAGIVHAGTVEDTEEGLSEFPHVILNQARVHQFYLDRMRTSPAGLIPCYGWRVADIARDGETPVAVTLENVDPTCADGTHTVHARYVVGCDGARSMVRRLIGQHLVGDSANQMWGVIDLLAVTDFPDIRRKCVISSAEHGSIVVIPREGGYLVRLYVEMDELLAGERGADREVTADDVIAAARRILHPHSLDVKQVAWWSAYEIGQRLCSRFDDLDPPAAGRDEPRVFIAGDACHTHSPKAGQGMNVSMQDAFNLGWKLAAVLQGRSPPELLRTYSDERQAIARELIEFDKEWAAMLSAPLRSADNPQGIDPAQVQAYFVRSGRYTAGTATRYAPSTLVGGGGYQHLATGYPVGARFQSAPVMRLADAKPMELGHVVEADGRWRLFVFAPARDLRETMSALARLSDFLLSDPRSPVVRHTPAEDDLDAVIDVRVVLPHARDGLNLVGDAGLPELLLPRKGILGLRDYEKIFCPARSADANIFALRGIDPSGCIVIVRPDQYVAEVLPFDAHDLLASFFSAVMVDRRVS